MQTSKFNFANLFKPNQKTFEPKPETWLAICLGLLIVGYLSPIHTAFGKNFLPNAFAFVCMAFGLMFFLPIKKLEKTSLATLTWFSLALYLVMQTALGMILYPDNMIFPVTSLFVAGLLSLAGSNIEDKKAFLNKVFVATYVMAILSFVIQILQIFDISWRVGFIELTHLSGNGRLFANFLQPNHAGYAFVLAFCGVLYHLSYVKVKPYQKKSQAYFYQGLLWLLFVVFTTAISFTQSRAGLVMAVAVIGVFFISQPIPIKDKILKIISYFVVFVLVYLLASWTLTHLTASYYGGSLGGVGRLVEGGGNRTTLTKQALVLFLDNPIFGAGWNNYMQAGIAHAHDFNWRENPNHSHNFLTMILAELGLVGALLLIPIIVMLWRCVHFKHSLESAIALSFVVATILYASVEFPLWYFRYLAVFAVFLGLVEQRFVALPNIFDNKNVKTVVSIILLFSVLATENYIWQFVAKRFHDSQRYFLLDLQPIPEDVVNEKTAIFGFNMYNDQIMATQTYITPEGDIIAKTRLFKNAMNVVGSQYYTLAYAKMLAFDGKNEQALEYIKIACVRGSDVIKNCNDVEQDLKKISEKYPNVFNKLLSDFQEWRLINKEKVGVFDPS